MKADIKKKWVKALRSGKYRKAKGALKTTKGYCCLGVLTDLYLKETKQKWEGGASGVYRHGTQTAVLPEDVMKWAGLRTSSPSSSIRRLGLRVSFTALNDLGLGGKEATFKDIAKEIEKAL